MQIIRRWENRYKGVYTLQGYFRYYYSLGYKCNEIVDFLIEELKNYDKPPKFAIKAHTLSDKETILVEKVIEALYDWIRGRLSCIAPQSRLRELGVPVVSKKRMHLYKIKDLIATLVENGCMDIEELEELRSILHKKCEINPQL